MRRKNTLSPEYIDKNTVVLAETGCWVWMLSTIKGGYGKVSVGEKCAVAHRAIWESIHGPIPPGLILCHRCDISCCVNPDHLFLGTHKDNSHDMKEKNRQAKGERIWMSKLNAEQASLIKKAIGSNRQIAKAFNVSVNTVRNIRIGDTWRHVQ